MRPVRPPIAPNADPAMAVNRVGSLVFARPAMTEITGSSSIRVMTCRGLRSILIGKKRGSSDDAPIPG